MQNKRPWSCTNSTIECCNKCTAPKRHVGCHSTCEDYKRDRKIYDDKKVNEIEQRKKAGRVMGKNEFNMLYCSTRTKTGKRPYINNNIK